MDPLSTIGLTSALISFIDFGAKIAARLVEYSSATRDHVPKALQVIASQLPLLIDALGRIKSQSQIDKLDTDTRCILRGVIVGCTQQIKEVEKILEQVKITPGQSLAIKIHKTFVGVLKNDKAVSAIEKNLHTYISILILHHVIDASESLSLGSDETYFEVQEKQITPFTPRDRLYRQLESSLIDAARSYVKEPAIVVLFGGKRAGKTQLALEFCHQAYSLRQFRTVFWLNGSTRESVSLGIESISNTVSRSKNGSQDDKIEFAKRFLRDLWHPWLIVFDDYDYSTLPEILDYLPKSGCGAIILIAREATAAALGQGVEVHRYLDQEGREEMGRQLAQAIYADDAEKAKHCLDHEADVNGLIRVGWDHIPNIHVAAQAGSENVLPILLEYDVNLNISYKSQKPIAWSIRSGRTSVIRILLDHGDRAGQGHNLDDAKEAFEAAARCGNLEIVKLLLDRRKAIAIQESTSALVIAASTGQTEVFEFLLDHVSSLTDIALERAIGNEHYEIARILCYRETSNPSDLLYYKTVALSEVILTRDQKYAIDMARILLDRGADPNSLRCGKAPIYWAATKGHTEIVQLLISRGANVGTSSEEECSLCTAIYHGHEETVKSLLQVELPDPAAKVAYLERALRLAVRQDSREMVLLILQSTNVDINCTDTEGETLLMLAVSMKHVQTSRLLLRNGARADIDNKGCHRYPLIMAAYLGSDILAKDLLRLSKDLSPRDDKGNTALCVAASRGHEKVVKLLLDKGADTSETNRFGDTALDLAEVYGMEKVVELLEGL